MEADTIPFLQVRAVRLREVKLVGEPGGEVTPSLAVLIMGQVCLLHPQGWLQNTVKGDQSGYRTSSPAPVFFFFFQDILWTKDPQFKFSILTAQYLPSNTNTHVDAGLI